MLIIAHRVNTVESLNATPRGYGVEMDVHAYGDRLVVHHDAFTDAVDFETWLDAYAHAFLVVNIKEEGVETRVLDILARRGIENFFLLDVSPPRLYQLAVQGEKRMAVRVSAYESVQTALALRGKVQWVFVDTLEEKLALTDHEHAALKDAGFMLCLVSHDVWGRSDALSQALKQETIVRKLHFDAVLTKLPQLWNA